MLIRSNGFLPNEILNASYNYTPHEIEVLLTVINSYKNNNTLVVSFDTLTVNFGKGNSVNKELKNAIKSILEKPLEYWNKETNTIIISAIVTSAEIDSNKRLVKFTLNETIAGIILNAKERYSRYNFETMLNLQSRYSKRLYLHCNAWRNTGVWEISIEKIRKLLGVENKYPQFFDLNTKILQPAFAEINEKSEYITTVDYLKNGKMYQTMLVSVVLKKQVVNQQQKHANELKRMGLVDWQIKNICNTLADHEIEKHLNQVKMNAVNIKNMGGYLCNLFSKVGVPLDKKLF